MIGIRWVYVTNNIIFLKFTQPVISWSTGWLSGIVFVLPFQILRQHTIWVCSFVRIVLFFWCWLYILGYMWGENREKSIPHKTTDTWNCHKFTLRKPPCSISNWLYRRSGALAGFPSEVLSQSHELSRSQMLHGAGIFNYITGTFLGFLCR